MKVYCTYHPAATLYPGGAVYRDYILDDLRRLRIAPLSPPPDGTPAASKVLGIDTEYLGEETLTVGLCDGQLAGAWERGADGQWPPRIKETLGGVPTLVVHSMPDDVYRLIAEGLLPSRREYLDGTGILDSLLLARLADENRLSYELENLIAALAPGGVDGWKAPTRDKDPEKWTAEERVARCRLDAWATLEVARRSAEVPKELYEFTARTAAVLYRLHLAGAVVDLARYRTVAERVEAKTRQVEDQLRKMAIAAGMTAFAASNDHHIRELLYDRLGLPVIATTEKTDEPTVGRAVLSELLEQDVTPQAAAILDALIEHSAIDKFRGTYAEGLRKLIHPCGVLADGTEIGWLPFNFNPLVRTGRRSSRRPNSQNWPEAARRVIRSRWVGGKIAAFDFSRLEPCIVAWLTGDEELLRLFLDGNGYLTIARELWRQEIEEGGPLYRGTKSIVLGVHYDMGTDEMANQLWTKGIRFGPWREHWFETDRARSRYLGRFPKLGQYMEQQRAERQETGQVIIPSGRIRHLAGRGKHLDNQAINAPVQGTASDITASALLDVEAALLDEYGLSLGEWVGMLWEQRHRFLNPLPGYVMSVPWQVPVMFNEVHDELTADLPPGHEKRAEELIIETMKAVPTFRRMVPSFDIPLKVGAKIRERWHGAA